MAMFHQVLGIIVLLQCTRIFVGPNTTPTTLTTPTAKPKTTRSTLSHYDYLKLKRMKKLQFEYYPNYGYEPYWAGGEWMLSTTVDPIIASGGTTTKRPTICGEECSHLLRLIKHVCARQSADTKTPSDGCGTVVANWLAARICEGNPGDNYNFGYHTFDTYCQFLDAQCHSKFYNHTRWVLVHVGKCKRLDDYFKPLWGGLQPASRMEWYLSSLGSSE